MAVKSLIETVTVGAGGAASIEFTDIPQDGSDLVLKLSIRNTDSSNIKIQPNGTDTTSGILLRGTGSTVQSFTTSVFTGNRDDLSTANTFGNSSVYISNYTSTTNKSISVDAVSENNGTAAVQDIVAFAQTSSVGVTTLKAVMQSAGNFMQYSTASLYKITAD